MAVSYRFFDFFDFFDFFAFFASIGRLFGRAEAVSAVAIPRPTTLAKSRPEYSGRGRFGRGDRTDPRVAHTMDARRVAAATGRSST